MTTGWRSIGFGLAAVASVAIAGAAHANSAGMYDRARTGCGTCHGGILPNNVTTLLQIDGLPEDGYVPGCTYDLSIAVLGVAVPAQPYTTLPLSGFSLEVTAGRLAGDQSILLWPETDCDVLARLEDCTPGSQRDPCPRSCDDVDLLFWQASHAKREPSNYGEMHRFFWDLRWTAPPPGAGTVTVFFSGGVGNGNNKDDTGDPWAVHAPITVEEEPSGSCP